MSWKDDWQAAWHAKRKGNAYATEAQRRVKAAVHPSTDDSPIYKEEQREVRYSGVRENLTGKKISVSSHERMRQAARRVRDKTK